jgi:5-oxoprolinase (ATP-hydrolysing) subunit C
MSLRVLDPGLYSLVVDFGRPRTRSLGVPVGGAADRTSLALGNALVGNPPDAAGLEVTLAGPRLEAACSVGAVVFGAPFDLTSNRQSLAAGKTFTLTPGEELHVGGCQGGARAYLCVVGGFDVPLVLGSRSSLTPLRAGDELPCRESRSPARFLKPEWSVSDPPLRALDGPQAGWFPAGGFFGGGEFMVTSASNRMGLRLRGKPLDVPPRELASEPVCPGTVQVTRDGQCIVLGVDGQTIGGYPKVAQVVSADLARLGQLRPGDPVRFQRVTMDEAERLHQRKSAALNEWLVRLRTAEVFGPKAHGLPPVG